MRNVAAVLALAVLPFPAIAKSPEVFVAILSETADGFKDLAECEAVLRGSNTDNVNGPAGKSGSSGPTAQVGSLPYTWQRFAL